MNWRINIPKEFKEIYHMETSSFSGDGYRYSVYSFDAEPSGFVSNFIMTHDNEIENMIKSIIQHLCIPDEYRPNLDISYSWISYSKYDTDSLIMLYYIDNKRIYIVQSIF